MGNKQERTRDRKNCQAWEHCRNGYTHIIFMGKTIQHGEQHNKYKNIKKNIENN